MLISTHCNLINFPYLHHKTPSTHLKAFSINTTVKKPITVLSFNNRLCGYTVFDPKPGSVRKRVSADDGGSVEAAEQESAVPVGEETSNDSSPLGDSYVALFIRMLGLDHDPLDREQAVVALWKYSLGGKKYIDAIMQFSGCLNLTVNLLKSESNAACEGAAGLLRSISSVNLYRESVAECGAVEEINALLNQPSLTSEVKEQAICTLWNLSVDEKMRAKIARDDTLPLLIKSLDDDDINVKEAAGGVLANLALSHSNHKIMVEAGVIPKLANLLKNEVEGSKITRKEARSALLKLAKDDYYKILVIEEGLIPVPFVGEAAYKSFKPELYSWPSLPDGTKIEQTSKAPSRFGASELLIGLHVDTNVNIEEMKRNAIVGRAQQHFLARIGAIEPKDENNSQYELPTERGMTLLPLVDGVARLVLILGLEDEVARARAADSIADASINEYMRISFKEAGAIRLLVQLLNHSNDTLKLSVTHALERLSISNEVCPTIEAEDGLHPLINTLKYSEISGSLVEKTLYILARIFDPSKEMKSKFYKGPVNGTKKGLDGPRSLDSSAALLGDTAEPPSSMQKFDSRSQLLDSAVIDRLVSVMKNASPNLQRKAASILEFITVINPNSMNTMLDNLSSGLDATFRQKVLEDMESESEAEQPEKYICELEEASLAISAASRLLTKLLDSDQFCQSISTTQFTKLLRNILKSRVPLHHKEWVAASLAKLSALSSNDLNDENPINMEITLYETIPRLMEQIKSSYTQKAKESAVMELNRILSEGVVDSTRAFATEEALASLVKLLEGGSERATEASLNILYHSSMDRENHRAIVAAGALPALRRIVVSQRPQWSKALRLLRNLPV